MSTQARNARRSRRLRRRARRAGRFARFFRGASMLTIVLDAITTAALLFIISSGLLIVFGVMKIINFAHAAFLTVGGYAALVGAELDLPWVLILPLAFLAGAICGGITE